MRQLKITKQITNRESKSLDSYLQEISKIPMISAEEEVELATRIKEGDKRAQDTLVRANLRFVVSVAKQYQNRGLNLPDLINEGNVGLIKAAERFDETRGFKFISYAVWWIRQQIIQALSQRSRVIRLPANKIGLLNKIRKTSAALEQRLERNPSSKEIADSLDLNVQDVKAALNSAGKHVSLDAPLKEDDPNFTLQKVRSSDSPRPDKSLMKSSLNTEVNRALNTLPAREGHLLKMYFGINGHPPMNLTEIAEKFDLTRERTRQIKEKALIRLRRRSANHILQTYLG